MKNPWYFNYGIAIHGAQNVPTHPASHGCVRMSNSLADVFPTLVEKGNAVYVWGYDGREPEGYTKNEMLPSFNRPDPNATTTTTTSTTIPTTTIVPTTVAPTTTHSATTTTPATTAAPTTAPPTTPVPTTVAPTRSRSFCRDRPPVRVAALTPRLRQDVGAPVRETCRKRGMSAGKSGAGRMTSAP